MEKEKIQKLLTEHLEMLCKEPIQTADGNEKNASAILMTVQALRIAVSDL